ncbi:hypothetical protein AB0F81_31250 [Actinoplanes sp. NPDC024001]|uniref:hypothetical protein n=1 Tax=Actinoplanes sp. NPDC024001 TaxID=3154598 RepID=UPI0033CBFA68
MSRQFRYRVAALMLSGLIFGAPLLTNGTASAEQIDEGGRRVSFDGGVLGLACESRPNVESLTVPAETVVTVLNRTGHDARLRLGGTPKGTVPDNGSAEVVFRRGTTSVLLTPDCADGGDAVPVLVTAASPDPSAKPDPMPAPGGGSASTMMSKPAGSGSPAGSRAGSALPDSVSPAQRPARATTQSTRRAAESRPASTTRAATDATQAMPQGGASPRLKIKTVRGTGGIGEPAFAGMPPGDRRTLLPVTTASPAAASVPAAPSAQAVEPTAEGTPIPPAVASAGGTLAEPIAAVGPIREGRPIGLLGLTALICVLGVSTAAIRAIVSQRASRTNIA